MKDRKIGSYRLLALIGTGGMGEVYSAYDQRLERRVAVKVVRPDLSTKPSTLARFRREARALARVSHPFVVQVFEVLEDEGSLCIVMELVEGQTLRSLLDESSPLPFEKVAFFGKELAEGLEAIHQASLIHRDLKAENVMVTSNGHLKILDFGLAKPLHSQPGESTVSKEGRVVGTYAAMSPEQVQGQLLDPKTDLFSLGLLLYEMSTGEHPFQTETAESTLIRICRDLQAPIHELRPDAPIALSRLINHLLAKSPEARPHNAGQVHKTLEAIDLRTTAPLADDSDEDRTTLGSSETLPRLVGNVVAPLAEADPAPTSRRRSPRRLIGLVAGAVLALWIAVGFWNSPDRTTLAVLELINTKSLRYDNSEINWYSSTIPRFLSEQLTSGEIQVLDPDWVTETRSQLGLEPGAINDKLWDALGADAVVMGSYLKPDPEAPAVLLELRLRRRDSAISAWSYSGETTPEILWSMLADRGHEIRQALDATTLTPGQARALTKTWPTQGPAAELYGLGLYHLSRLEGKDAVSALEDATALDPDSARLWDALAEAYRLQGRSKKALTASRQYLAKIDQQSEQEYLAAQARVREDEGQWQEAADLREKLLRRDPQDLALAWRLAYTYAKGDRPKEALDALERARAVSGADADPRFPLLAARVHYDQGQLSQGQAEAERAETLARNLSAPGFLGQALLLQILPALQRGDKERVISLRSKALEQLEQTGDQVQIIHVVEYLAFFLWGEKKLADAEKWYRTALESYEEVGYTAGVRRAMKALGAVLGEQGRTGEASALFKRAQGDDNTEVQEAKLAANDAVTVMIAGDLASAEIVFRESLAVFSELNYPKVEAIMLSNLAEIEYLRAHLDKALKGHREARDLNRLIEIPADYNEVWIARIQGAQGLFDEASQQLLKLIDGESPEAGEANLRLAELMLYRGRTASAVQTLETLLAGDSLNPYQKVFAQDLLARCKLALGLHAEAEKARAAAAETALGQNNLEVELRLRITGALIQATLDPEDDRVYVQLRELTQRAESADFRILAFEARFVEARIQFERSQDPLALERLRLEFREQGLEGLARRAEMWMDSAS